MNIVIFSRNRPAQLDALLTSLKLNMIHGYDGANISVIFKDDMEGASAGYCRLFKDTEKYGPALHTGINLLYQSEGSDFKKLTLKAVDPMHEQTMFLVDDIVFKGRFSTLEFPMYIVKDSSSILCTSLRLWEGINHCYPTNTSVRAPLFQTLQDDAIVFDWNGKEGDWGYPMSVDGHVFRTDFILAVLNAVPFHNPNSLEGNMAALCGQGYFLHKPKMVCYKSGSRLLNIPANRVQDEAPNKHGSLMSPEEINLRFLTGDRIDISVYQGYQNNAPHIELPLKWLGTTDVDQRTA